MRDIYQAINDIIRYWREEGDNANARELWDDAIIHLRWKRESKC